LSDDIKATGLGKELAIYCALGIVPFIAAVALMGVSVRGGLYLLAGIVFLVAFATVRFGLFLGIEGRQWLVVFLLFIAGYVGSYVYLFYRAYLYHKHPPQKHEESEPRFMPGDDSAIPEWSQPHGHGGGD
jgi:hypothetical protein